MITAFIFIICLFISIVVGPIFFISGLLLLKKYNKKKWFEVDGVIVKKEIESSTNRIVYSISYIFNTANYIIYLYKTGKSTEIGESVKLLVSKTDNNIVKLGEKSTFQKVLGITFLTVGSLIFIVGLLFFIPLVVIDL